MQHYEDCFARFGDTHKGADWPNDEDAEKRYRVMLDLVRESSEGMSLLDFGCGTSRLYSALKSSRHSGLEYLGLDFSAELIEVSKKKYPHIDFICADVLAEPELMPECDYVVMNGVFTEKLNLEFQEMFEYFKQVLRVVYPKVRVGIAFNVMSKEVDWERDDLFHVPIDPLVHFLAKEVSRNFVIRNDYGLYEYTVYVYRDGNNG